MPKIIRACHDIDHTFTRPVVLDIARQLMSFTGIPTSTRIYLPGELDSDIQVGAAIDSDKEIKFKSDDKVTIEVDEEVSVDRALTNAIGYNEQMPIAIDRAIGLLVKPIYIKTDYELNIRFRTTDKYKAARWKTDIKNRISMLRDVFEHTAEFHYFVNNEVVNILRDIHNKAEALGGYGRTFEKFINHVFSKRASFVTNSIGENPMLAISDKLVRILGYFDFDATPDKGEKEGDTNAWTISCVYKFSIDKPESCFFQYPLMVHNQLIDSKYYDDNRIMDEHDKENTGRSLSLSALSAFEVQRIKRYDQYTSGYSVPTMDDFLPTITLPGTVRLYTALTSISDTDRRSLMKIDELIDVVLHPAIVEFMRGEANRMSLAYKSVFQVSVFRGQMTQTPDNFTIDSNLNLVSKYDLSLRDVHRVRLSVVSDFYRLDKDALDRLRRAPIVLNLILQALHPKMPPLPIVNGMIQESDIRDLVWKISKLPNTAMGWNRVQTLFVEVTRL